MESGDKRWRAWACGASEGVWNLTWASEAIVVGIFGDFSGRRKRR